MGDSDKSERAEFKSEQENIDNIHHFKRKGSKRFMCVQNVIITNTYLLTYLLTYSMVKDII
jgi:hypothetical protein